MENDHNLTGMKMGLDEAKESFKLVIDSIDELSSKARSLLSSASLVIAITTALGLNDLIEDPISFRSAAMVIILILYVLLVRYATLGMKPISILGAIEPKFSNYEKWFHGKDQKDILVWLTKVYLNSIQKALPENSKKSTYVSLASYLLMAIVVLLIITPFLPAGSIAP